MQLRAITYVLTILLLCSCNNIEIGSSLSPNDLQYIKTLHLLEDSEKVQQFFSNRNKKKTGNFFSDKRIASYWIDQRIPCNQVSFAYYNDIRKIDTVYDAGLTLTPYMQVTRNDCTQFKVYVNGNKRQVKNFFESAIRLWKEHRTVSWVTGNSNGSSKKT